MLGMQAGSPVRVVMGRELTPSRIAGQLAVAAALATLALGGGAYANDEPLNGDSLLNIQSTEDSPFEELGFFCDMAWDAESGTPASDPGFAINECHVRLELDESDALPIEDRGQGLAIDTQEGVKVTIGGGGGGGDITKEDTPAFRTSWLQVNGGVTGDEDPFSIMSATMGAADLKITGKGGKNVMVNSRGRISHLLITDTGDRVCVGDDLVQPVELPAGAAFNVVRDCPDLLAPDTGILHDANEALHETNPKLGLVEYLWELVAADASREESYNVILGQNLEARIVSFGSGPFDEIIEDARAVPLSAVTTVYTPSLRSGYDITTNDTTTTEEEAQPVATVDDTEPESCVDDPFTLRNECN